MTDFDGVVVGAGHNGLTLAAYLARAGLRIAVLERNGRIGGGTSTEERILPGFRLNLHANFFMGLGLCPLLHDLQLHRYGFSYIEPPVQQAAVFRDGTAVVIYKDVDRTCASLARFSKQDAEAFRALWRTYCEEMRPLLVSLLYNAPLSREQLVDRLSGPKAKELLSHAQHDLFSVVRKHFVDERIRTLFTSYMHVITTENVPGAGIVFPAIFANIASFTLPAGGAAALPLALARVVEAGGGEVVTGCDVREINVKNGRAIGVTLSDGRKVGGRRFIASAIDFPATVRLAGEQHFPEPVREKARAWHWGNHSLVTLHLALRDPPAYRAATFDVDVSRAYNIFFGMDHIDDVASCFEDCAAKKFPRILMGNGACNSQFDPSYAPAGQHTAFWWPFAPYSVDGSPQEWERNREGYARHILDYWRTYASNLEGDNLLGSYLFTPLDIERQNANMRQGAVRVGAYIPDQLGINRPHPLLPGSRTPVEGLYLCGSSSGNGGGVNGAAGYIAANAIVDDLKLKRSWTPVPPPEWKH
ncbi:MAG TPA: NAD(P)/FAD-dependent oxidoreductase [Pseudolabrys sp.]|nr:NAD(P)/FAD-dependent oxidoreductase [Pseudolabrys sp.]